MALAPRCAGGYRDGARRFRRRNTFGRGRRGSISARRAHEKPPIPSSSRRHAAMTFFAGPPLYLVNDADATMRDNDIALARFSIKKNAKTTH